ncbi:MAG: YfcE family phosphodiesterase, partial [Treponemataceae bacterium]|nr:YfcE family phosphodiesterase [Treponemataceae bacterium]
GYSPPALHMVRGNGDGDPRLPLIQTITVGERCFLLTHGHVQAVHDGLDQLISVATASGVDGVLYGHTHRPFWEEIGGRLFLNPGSLGKPRSKEGATFATITVPPSGWFEVQYYHLTEGPFGGRTIKKIALFGP